MIAWIILGLFIFLIGFSVYNLSKPTEIKIKLLYDDAKIPTKAHNNDAAFDMYAYVEEGLDKNKRRKPIVIPPGKWRNINCGFSASIPKGWFGDIRPRSGMATKHGIDSLAGTIDADYLGCYFVCLQNNGNKDYIVHHGDRIAQIAILPVPDVVWTRVNELPNTQRSKGGFGSTGE